MRFYGLGYSDIFGNAPIPTPVLDEMAAQIERVRADEMLDQIAVVHGDPQKLRDICLRIISPRTGQSKRQMELDAYKDMLKLVGKEIDAETRKIFMKEITTNG